MTKQAQKRHLDFLISPSFLGVNRLFVLSSEKETGRTEHRGYYLPTVEIKDHNITINERNCFNKFVKNDVKTFENIQKIVSGEGDDWKTSFLLDYLYFEEI